MEFLLLFDCIPRWQTNSGALEILGSTGQVVSAIDPQAQATVWQGLFLAPYLLTFRRLPASSTGNIPALLGGLKARAILAPATQPGNVAIRVAPPLTQWRIRQMLLYRLY